MSPCGPTHAVENVSGSYLDRRGHAAAYSEKVRQTLVEDETLTEPLTKVLNGTLEGPYTQCKVSAASAWADGATAAYLKKMRETLVTRAHIPECLELIYSLRLPHDRFFEKIAPNRCGSALSE